MTEDIPEDKSRKERFVNPFEAEKEYFANLPFKEETVREVVASLKTFYWGKADFDPKTVDLAKILTPPALGRFGGVRIKSLTEGHGKHWVLYRPEEYDVPENEVYVTIDDTRALAGRIVTYKFKREEKGLKLTGEDVHAVS